MNYIRRHLESRVIAANKAFKAVLVTGARQTGKSTLLKRLFPDRHCVSFDDPFTVAMARNSATMFMGLNRPPVIFDEVQRVPDLFRYIKIACDESDARGLFCLSSSQTFSRMHGVSESLAGRVGIIELSTLSLREIQRSDFTAPFLPTMDYIRERQKTALRADNIWEIIHKGGYPELYQHQDMDWQVFYSSYIRTYLERDVRELTVVQDLDAFRRFMVAAAVRTGQMLNYSAIAREIGKDVTTVKRWVSILEASGIIYLLEPYTPSVLKRAVKTPKLYFRDTGLVSYLSRWLTPETLACGAMADSIFETFVVSEILKSYANQGIDYRYCVSYYRGRDRRKVMRNGQEKELEGEIDLIIESDGFLFPLEIKKNTSETDDATEAFTVLDAVPDRKRGMGAVISLCPGPGMLRENVFEIPVWYI